MPLRRLIITGLLLSGLTGPVLALPELPELGGSASEWLTPEQEELMGQAWLRQLYQRVPVLQDPLVQEYTENLVYRIASHGRLQRSELSVVVINSREINAFAVPGGIIGLNAGLFLHGEAEGELAAVVAHEIAHVSQNHFARRYARGKRMSRAMLAAMLASVAAAVAGETQAGMAGMAASQAAAIQSQLAYSRHHEREADRIGMQTLARAGFDPGAMPDFFERLLRQKQFTSEPPEFLLTHPLTRDRVADSRARATRMPRPEASDNGSFPLIQARVRARFFTDAEQAITHFREDYDDGTSHASLAAGYGLGLAHMRAENFDRAGEILARLRRVRPNQLWFAMAEAELAAARNRHGSAVERLREVLEIMPGNHAASVLLARNLLRAGQPAQAQTVLDELLLDRPGDPGLWKMLADAHGKQNHSARAHRARGEYLFLTGQEEKGIEQLRYALQASGDEFAQHSRIESRLREMERLRRAARELR